MGVWKSWTSKNIWSHTKQSLGRNLKSFLENIEWFRAPSHPQSLCKKYLISDFSETGPAPCLTFRTVHLLCLINVFLLCLSKAFATLRSPRARPFPALEKISNSSPKKFLMLTRRIPTSGKYVRNSRDTFATGNRVNASVVLIYGGNFRSQVAFKPAWNQCSNI